jgi:hypothetical protein
MRLLGRVRARVRANLQSSRMEREMETELGFHLETRAEDLMREGVSRNEAMRRARIEFGALEGSKEECRDARGVGFAESALLDLRFGLRMLRNNPGFAGVAVLTLGLAIGANAAIFTVISAVLLRPLAVQHPEQLVAVHASRSDGGAAV